MTSKKLVMPLNRVQKKIDWTSKDRARHQAIRDTFKDKPSIDQLVARGELAGNPISLNAYLNLYLLSATFVNCANRRN